MQIVINIDDEDYKKVLDANNRDIGWNIAHACYEAVLDGTPLPKGHGRLIDADKLANEIFVIDSYSEKSVIKQINDASTIIEADTNS